MYLRDLTDNQQKSFLELAIYLAKVDGEFAESEQELIMIYRNEMDLLDEEYQIKHKQLHEILEDLDSSSELTKRKIVIELVGLAHADDKLVIEESDLIANICKRWGIPLKEVNPVIANLKELKKIYGSIESFIYQEVES